MQSAQKEIRILHVDDAPEFLAATKALLERRNEDFRVDITTSAEEGLKLLKRGNYDAVISDYQMSVMDGLKFLRKLRERGSTIPFIVFTGKSREEVAIEALNNGANHYLQKGGDRESLYKTLAHVVKEEVAKKRAEDKLVEKEREYQTLLNSLPLNIFHIDRNNTFVHVNEVLAQHYGLKPEDFKGRTTKELFPAETEAFIHSDQEVLERGKPQIGVRRAVTTPQGVRWVRLDKVPVKDAYGNVTGLIGFELDVTERKQMEEALRESEERFRSIVEHSHDGILIIDDAFHATYVNDELCRILGYSRDECIGQDFRNFLDEESKRLVADRYRRRQQGEQIPARYEFTILRKDGAKRQVEISSAVTKDSAGNVQTIAQILDITERKRAVKKLQRSEKEHQMVLDSVPVSIFHLDANSNFVQVNETLAKRYGLKPVDFKDRATTELFPEQAKSFSDSDREVLESGTPHIGLIRKIKTSEGVRWVRLDKVPIKDADGTITGIVGFELDITDRKETEDERKRLLKELEAKNEELEHFTYTVSHDLRSPLVTIQGFTGLLEIDLERDAKEKAENDLKYISSAAAKMDELLNATLELSRIGRIANPPEDVPFGKIVEGAMQQTAGAITANAVEVTVVDAFPVVHVDRMRIEEVLVNLITNSIKYRGDQPHPKLEIGHRVDGEETVFFVKDNGIGIDTDQHEAVFELFHQVGSGNGTGAGLAIVKRIIEVHEGRIWIESARGKGCTVCFTLPVN